jgi:hypothetical protein
MLLLINDFIGYEPIEHNVVFSGSDSEELYIKNLKSKSIDWYYRTKQISYIRNSNGHRCKEIKDINLSNYILYAGCSHTEGIGLELEKTYPYLLSKSLGCDYYNISIGGSGIDVLLHNLIVWFGTVKQKPKLVIIQWPFWARYARFTEEPTNTNLQNNYISTISGIKDHTLMEGEGVHYFKTIEHLARIKLNHIIDVPIINVGLAEFPSIINDDFVIFDNSDNARDTHMGIESNKNLASKLYNRMHEINTI